MCSSPKWFEAGSMTIPDGPVRVRWDMPAYAEVSSQACFNSLHHISIVRDINTDLYITLNIEKSKCYTFQCL